MKKLLKLTSIIVVTLMFTSCLVDDTATTVNNDQGPNLVGFTKSKINASVVSDGEPKEVLMTVEFSGPTASEFTEDFSVTIGVDPSSTAVEGVHYTLNASTLNLSSSTNYIANIPVTIITEGIEPPLDVNPVLTLKITEISNGSVVPNGRTASIDITVEYLCFSDITGKYKAIDAAYFRINAESSLSTPDAWPAETEIIYICNGLYRVLEYFGPEAFTGNEYYFQVDELGTITYPATTPTGDIQTGNGQPFITCQTNPQDMTNVPCGATETNFVEINGDVIRLHMTFGYFTGTTTDSATGQGPREFYQLLEKL